MNLSPQTILIIIKGIAIIVLLVDRYYLKKKIKGLSNTINKSSLAASQAIAFAKTIKPRASS